MTDLDWTPEQLELIDGADEIQIASRRPDGSLRPFITIWAVRVDDEVIVRSAYGTENGWYRRALASGGGAIRVGGAEIEVAFGDGSSADHAAIDVAYHSKYDRYGARIVGSVVGPAAASVTVRLQPTKA